MTNNVFRTVCVAIGLLGLGVLSFLSASNIVKPGGSSTPPYNQWNTDTGITMTGSPVTAITLSGIAALPAGACYTVMGAIIYSGNGLSDISVAVDGTVIATPYNMTATSDDNFTFRYCNLPGFQNIQAVLYQNGLSFGVGYPNMTGLTEAGIIVPSAFDWSTTHDMSIVLTGTNGLMIDQVAIVVHY